MPSHRHQNLPLRRRKRPLVSRLARIPPASIALADYPLNTYQPLSVTGGHLVAKNPLPIIWHPAEIILAVAVRLPRGCVTRIASS